MDSGYIPSSILPQNLEMSGSFTLWKENFVVIG
jgi:hypothetical protein